MSMGDFFAENTISRKLALLNGYRSATTPFRFTTERTAFYKAIEEHAKPGVSVVIVPGKPGFYEVWQKGLKLKGAAK